MTTRRGAALLLGGALALCAAPRAARAQQGCPAPSPAARPRAWSAPLDRPVSLHARDIALRDALERLSSASSVAFAYSSDLVALDRRVCVSADAQPLGQVLEAILGAGAVPSVVAGRVVLVPRTAQAATRTARADAPDMLERVVVTGNAVATSRRGLAIGVDVIDGARLRRQSLTSLADILDGGTAGAWLWSSSPGTVLAQYGGIRGASSFGSSAPKVYLDGIEVANPLLLTQLDPDAVERIEVIRGPQGSALYGSDAISGVVNVVSRHDGAAATGSRLTLSSTAGASESRYGTSLVPTHDQRIAVRAGSPLHSAGVAAQFGQSGAVFPSAESRTTSVSADARLVGSDAVWTFSGRLFDHRAGSGQNPLLSGLAPAAGDTAAVSAASPFEPRSARQYTLGGNVTLAADGAWTHTAVFGVDGYRLRHVNAAAGLYPVPADSALGAAEGSGDRTTLRLGSVGHFGGEGSVPATTVTVGFDQAVLRLELPSNGLGTVAGAGYLVAAESAPRWNHDAGVFGQLSTAWNDALFVSAGVRVEQNDAFTGRDRHPVLPMLGVAAVRQVGAAQVKLRAAYGKGIRPPTTTARGVYQPRGNGITALPALDAEAQSGTELGIELYMGEVAQLQLTRFDQLASGLIQNVLVGVDTQARGGHVQQLMIYQLQNVGQIGNHGWELQGSVARGAASLSGALTAVDSRVRTVSNAYGGDLRAGDRMLGVPARTASLTASFDGGDWSGAVTASRAWRWVNYDRLSLARDYAARDSGAAELVGARLRDYWMEYDGETRLRVSASRALHGSVELVLTGDNLLGGQVGEPDNVTIRPGRTVTAGLRAGF